MTAQPLEAAWTELAPRLAAAERLLIGLDFDGTLAPLAPTPAQAELPSQTRSMLADLAARPGVFVALISGRGLNDLRDKAGDEAFFRAGNHGLEAEGPHWSFVEPAALPLMATAQQLAVELREALGRIPGVVIEDKQLSLSVHWRLVEAALAWTVKWTTEAIVGRQPDFRIREGHKVFEVRPNLPASKGTVLGKIASHLKIDAANLLYAGDDATDEEAFAHWPESVTIRVGPPEAPTAASFRVEGPADIERLLRRLLALR